MPKRMMLALFVATLFVGVVSVGACSKPSAEESAPKPRAGWPEKIRVTT